ncbi:TPA: fimbrial biogenesis chaperone [Serratia fonticola]
MKNTYFFLTLLTAILMSDLIGSVQAAVYIEGTRIIFPANNREITVKTTNKGKTPALMQIWLDRGNSQSQPHNADAPFLVTPPIFRLDAGKGQSIRLAFTGEKLPQDRESLFWFNALEVPPLASSDKSYMQIAVRSRLKLFYRPEGLASDPISAVKKVTWKIHTAVPGKGYSLRGENPTPYYVTYSKLALSITGKVENLGTAMIAPFSSSEINLKKISTRTGEAELIYRAMGDYGVGVEQKTPVH